MKRLSRRDFAKATVAAGAATALGRLRILGAIGCGDRAMQLWPIFLKQADVNAVAVCDVYEPYLNKAAATVGSSVAKHRDFRRLLETKDLDAVIVATPDHWH